MESNLDPVAPIQPQTLSPEIKVRCEALRKSIRWAEIEARSLRDLPWIAEPESYPSQHGEMIAQSMLAVRALEEARMRLGKVLQYAGDGVSIYDKT
jgi:hypothetical protein